MWLAALQLQSISTPPTPHLRHWNAFKTLHKIKMKRAKYAIMHWSESENCIPFRSIAYIFSAETSLEFAFRIDATASLNCFISMIIIWTQRDFPFLCKLMQLIRWMRLILSSISDKLQVGNEIVFDPIENYDNLNGRQMTMVKFWNAMRRWTLSERWSYNRNQVSEHRGKNGTWLQSHRHFNRKYFSRGTCACAHVKVHIFLGSLDVSSS